MARRGRGEGSITKRPDGRWMARIDLGWRDGKRRYKAYYGRTRAAVQDKLRDAIGDVQKGLELPDERQTTQQFLRTWLTHKQTQLRSRAYATYVQAVDLHLAPGIGKVPVARLTPQHVQAWFTEHQKTGASARTIRYARTVLRAALNQALRWNLVVRNAAALVEPPRHVARQIQPLTPEEARTLLASSKNDRLGALVSVATALGLRMGEALGLRWEDVDFAVGTLSVRQAIERSGGDSVARRPLILQRRALLKELATTPKRSAERRFHIKVQDCVNLRILDERHCHPFHRSRIQQSGSFLCVIPVGY
jgi:integrase